MRKIDRSLIGEAFQAEYLDTAATKVASILSKRIGVDIRVDIVNSYFDVNNPGVAIFKASINEGDAFISFDFENRTLVSLSLYPDAVTEDAMATVDLNGYNIVKVIDDLTDILMTYTSKGVLPDDRTFYYEDEYGRIAASVNEHPKTNLQERQRKKDVVFQRWVDSVDGAEDKLQHERLSRLYKDEVKKWLDDNMLTMSLPSFINYAKEYLANKGLENDFTRKVTIVKGRNISYEKPQAKEEADWERIKASGYEGIYEQIDGAVNALIRGAFNSVYVYGQPSSGKTTQVLETLKNNGVNYTMYKGGLKGVDELVKILYENREDEILLFDDFDSAFKNRDKREIILAAMEDREERLITWYSPRMKQYKIPDRFTFTSGIIVITNQMKLDSAIADRSVAIPVFLDKEQILDKLNKNLGQFMPKVPIEIKEEVLAYFLDNIDNLKRISFRQFKIATGFKLMNPSGEKWKVWTERSLNAL